MTLDKQKPNSEIGYVKPREIAEEMKTSYIDYAMSVIVSRALPDVRDGLKPVQRRILYTMYEMGLRPESKFRKSATVVGGVLGRYHPHGDMPVYGALVRLGQDFSLRYPLVKPQGNFGCFTKDTKVRLCDGRSLNFKELIREQKKGKRHWTFSFNHQEEKIEIAEIKRPRLTRRNEKLVEITLDNKELIRCTPDHNFMLRDGAYKEAINLKPGDSLMPFYTKAHEGKNRNLKGYETVFQPKKGIWDFTHHLADAWNLKANIYPKSAGRIRHHKDFNKDNNNPDNIQRVQWRDHWQLHKEIASSRHRNDPQYVERLAEGRKKFWSDERNRAFYRERQSKRNKAMWQVPKYREAWTGARKRAWEDPHYREFMRGVSSENLKSLWRKKEFKQLMSRIKSQELKRRWQDQGFRIAVAERTREFSLKIWSNPCHREYISRTIKEKFNKPEVRKKISERTKELWKDPGYRAKYPSDHFSKMAKKLWAEPGTRSALSKKAKKQWEDPTFRRKMASISARRGEKLYQEKPQFMKKMTERARIVLKEKWQDPEYKERVIKSKILGHVFALSNKYPRVTAELYEHKRGNNGVPKLENALNYFDSFSEILSESEKHNHKVIKVKFLKKREDVYDLTVDPWHNFALGAGIFVHNSIDGDPPAAQRYTEAKLSKLGEELLKDIEKETVDFAVNFDGTRKEPVFLPSPLPNLLLNGALGIAVGMATSIPPHNLTEVCQAVIHLIDHPRATVEELFEFIKGPDFPTGGIIYDKNAIISAYSQGKGPVLVRGKAEIEEKKGRFQIVIWEIPFGVQKSILIQQIAKLIQADRLKGARDVRDESDREGMRVVIDLKPGMPPQKALNALFRYTSLQSNFHLNLIALIDGIQPKVLGLVDILNEFISHRKQIVLKRAKFDLIKTKERAHILEGLAKALKNIDAIIKTIKASKDKDEAGRNLVKKFKLTKIQAGAILEMRLSALARLEREKIQKELNQAQIFIKELESIIKSPAKIKNIIKKELKEYQLNFGDERKTKLVSRGVEEFAPEDLIAQEATVITLTQKGFIKRLKPSVYKVQKRGGKGVLGQRTEAEDVVKHLLVAKTHDDILFFTDSGKVFQTKAYEIPEAKRVARGKSLLNFLELSAGEKVLDVSLLNKQDEENKYFIMVTKNGIIKKTALSEFENLRRNGLIAIKLRANDFLEKVQKTSGEDDIILVTRQGKSIRFKEKAIRPMGRSAAGVRGIKLAPNDEVIGMAVVRQAVTSQQKSKIKNYLLVVSQNGYGKRTEIDYYRSQRRGGTGIKTANITVKTGHLIASRLLSSEKHLVAISQKGHVIKIPIDSISKMGRSTQGVRIMKMDKGDRVASITCF